MAQFFDQKEILKSDPVYAAAFQEAEDRTLPISSRNTMNAGPFIASVIEEERIIKLSEELRNAIGQPGNEKKIGELIGAGADVTRRDANGWTPALLAAHTGDMVALDAILNKSGPAEFDRLPGKDGAAGPGLREVANRVGNLQVIARINEIEDKRQAGNVIYKAAEKAPQAATGAAALDGKVPDLKASDPLPAWAAKSRFGDTAPATAAPPVVESPGKPAMNAGGGISISVRKNGGPKA